MVDLAGDVALQTADGLAPGLALSDAALDVVLGALVQRSRAIVIV